MTEIRWTTDKGAEVVVGDHTAKVNGYIVLTLRSRTTCGSSPPGSNFHRGGSGRPTAPRGEKGTKMEHRMDIICPPEPKPAEPEPETPVVPAPEARPLPPGVKSCTFDELLSALEAHRQGRVRAAETAEEEA